jgi:hypothetical protein
VNGKEQKGSYEVNFDAKGLSSGIYFYKFTAGNFTEMKKMILLKWLACLWRDCGR